MTRLPDEIWVQVLNYLDPTDLLSVQRTSKQLLKIARDASIWREKCFEKAPSAVHAFSNADSLTDLLNGLSLNARDAEAQPRTNAEECHLSRRARAIAKWDCTAKNENIDWYSEYVARHAPLSTEWLHHPEGNEIRGMALFPKEEKVLGAMEDGSLRIWEVRKAASGRRSLHEIARSPPGVLFTDLCSESGPSASPPQPTVGIAIDSVVVKQCGKKAYIAVENILNEVDLTTMSIDSQNKYAWKITAISQQTGDELPLMVGTSFSLHMHDPRLPLKYQTHKTDREHDDKKDEENTVFLPNYSKSWMSDRTSSPYSSRRRHQQGSPTGRKILEAWAPVEPGPQAILHSGPNEIIVAGRMPSILFYDKRTFPRLESVIHSGARLSSLAILPYPPHSSTSTTAQATLIAAGEYHGRGSLEIYELPHHRASDRKPSYTSTSETDPVDPTPTPLPEEQSAPYPELSQPTSQLPPDDPAPYSHKNRQSSSSAKLLSVTPQGARLLYSDTEGKIHHLERNARGLARRWNINSYTYSHAAGIGAVVGESVARKILTFPSDARSESGATRGDGDLLIWTGGDIGIVTSRLKWTGHDELVRAFEEQMTLEEGAEGARLVSMSEKERREREEEYGRVMRRALERQADERRFLARFGRVRP